MLIVSITNLCLIIWHLGSQLSSVLDTAGHNLWMIWLASEPDRWGWGKTYKVLRQKWEMYYNILKMIQSIFQEFTLHRYAATALWASTHKFDLSTIHFHGHDTDEQCVYVLRPGDEVVGSAAQEAPIQGPKAWANSRKLQRDRELLTRECSAVNQTFPDFCTGF